MVVRNALLALLLTFLSMASFATGHQVTLPPQIIDRQPLGLSPASIMQPGVRAALAGPAPLYFGEGDIEVTGDTSKVWRGVVRDNAGRIGQGTITTTGDRVYGRIEIGSDEYRVHNQERGQLWLERMDPDRVQAAHPPMGPRTEPLIDTLRNAPGARQSDEPVSAANSAGTEPQVDLLLIYTPGAVAHSAYADEAALRLAIRNAVDNTNTALINSGVAGRVRLVASVLVDDTLLRESERDDDMGRALSHIRTDNAVRALAQLHSVDAVALIGRFSGYCGLGYLLTRRSTNWSDWSYSVTSANVGCLGAYTLAHELGHNFGLNHDDIASDRSRDSFSNYAYGHFRSRQFRTIMAYGSSCSPQWNCPQIAHFSNPDVLHTGSGLPTGEHDKDNARVLRETLTLAAGWRNQPGTFAQALGMAAGIWRTSGDGAWVVQSEQRYQGEVSALSPPIHGNEQASLTLELPAPTVHPQTLTFQVRAWQAGASGTLVVTSDQGETLYQGAVSNTSWQPRDVAVPAGVARINWRWQGTGANATNGQILMAAVAMDYSPVELRGFLFNKLGQPINPAQVTIADNGGLVANASLGSVSGSEPGAFAVVVDGKALYDGARLYWTGGDVNPAWLDTGQAGCDDQYRNCQVMLEGADAFLAVRVDNLTEGLEVSATLAVADEDGHDYYTHRQAWVASAATDLLVLGAVDGLIIWDELRLEAEGYQPLVIAAERLVRQGLSDPQTVALTKVGAPATTQVGSGSQERKVGALSLWLLLLSVGLLSLRRVQPS
ncbi:MAG: M12 family metallo-peptidase [Marinobacter sp.]|nr:M12 family metallo-peptidase [Marinobacter sp.]